ncbi:MAG: tetratricopeptide repeat protein [Pseudomonadota bacterium]
MTDRFLIVQVSPNIKTGGGDYIYRIRQPAEAMGRLPGTMVVNLPVISPYLKQWCLCADILILHLTWEPDLLPIVAERKLHGLATVFEISDNFLALPPSINHELSFNNPISLATALQLIRLSDAIQGVSKILLDQFSFLHERRVVFENQIIEMGSVQKTSKEEVVIGWAGSLGHTEDIQWMAPVIQEICQRHSHVRFAFMGNREQYEEVFGSVANSQFSYRDPGDLFDYYNFLDGLDIGLAPLMNTPFNICRSDVKFIEYASCGVIPVVSDVGPYKRHARHGVNAFLFESPESLRNILEILITDESLRQNVKANAYDYVKNERREEAHAVERVSFYKRLSTKRSFQEGPLCSLERYRERSEAYYIRRTPAETKVIRGIDLENKGNAREAREAWLEAARDLPEYYFPFCCIAQSLIQEGDLTNAFKFLGTGLAINPKSLRLRLLLGVALKKEDTKAAREEFEKTLQIFPDFALAWKEIGLLEKEQGNLDEAAKLMNKALEANPFYAVAASELGKIYLAQEKKELAAEAFRVAANLIPDRLDYQIDLIKALIEIGNLEEATQECVSYLKRQPDCEKMNSILETIRNFQVNNTKGHETC